MATIYKRGSWAEHGRILPGCRTKPKKIDQILEDGKVICVGTDQKFAPKEMQSLLLKCFPESQKLDGRVYLPAINKKGRGVCFYTRNVNHLGGDWGSEKKRIQIGKDFPDIYRTNEEKDIATILLGIYHYFPDGENGVVLFVCFSSNTYASRSTHNSAAHVHTIDLLNAHKKGVYRRLDKSGNEILVLNTENFIKHINSVRGNEEITVVRKDREVLEYLGQIFESMPRYLKGIDCYQEMMAAKNTARMNQGAWEGWYCEFFFERYIRNHPTKNILWWSKKEEGQLDFDLRFPYEDWFYGDMKSDAEKKDVQGNVKENIDFLVQEKGGRLWYITLDFTPERDSDHGYMTTKWWNQKLGKHDNLMSYSKRMKYAIKIHKMDIYEITTSTIPYLKVYYPSPCGGKQRKPKYKIPHKVKEFLRIYECK